MSPTPKEYAETIEQGKQIFRYDTFGDEVYWGDTLRLHETVAQLPPAKALELGLKVDSDALPAEVITQLKAGKLDVNDPAVTLTLLKLKAVVGVTGRFDSSGKQLASMGVQCALCHSTVDDAVAPGIGRRLDGWANRDLNVGVIVASAPDLSFLTKLFSLSEESASIPSKPTARRRADTVQLRWVVCGRIRRADSTTMGGSRRGRTEKE